MNQIQERPILMSAPMVCATLREVNPKTQTRRVIKPQCELTTNGGFSWKKWLYGLGFTYSDTVRNFALKACPYGKPGDRLWVRETWRVCASSGDHIKGKETHFVEYKPCSPNAIKNGWQADTKDFHFDIDENVKIPCSSQSDFKVGGGLAWRPSIFMPRWASRILLEIVSVRVERLQDISASDARSEGCQLPDLPKDVSGVAGDYVADERTSFAILWSKINGPGSWNENPWVWVIEFKRI
jgi:hypothetical protein